MKTAYMFPGQGSQYASMGKDLFENYPSARAVFDQADKVLGFSLSTLCFEGPEDELKKTVNAQPALLTMSMACLAAVKEAHPDVLPAAQYMLGHSLGEYSALTASGALDFDTAVTLARDRGSFMYEAGLKKTGGMVAIISMECSELKSICQEAGAYIANLNCPGQIVISGTTEAVKTASKLAKERGAKLTIPLAVSGAFHSPLMQSAADRLKPEILAADINMPRAAVIGNTTAQELGSVEDIQKELITQVSSCVKWDESIQYLLSQGVDTFVEFGPGTVLTGLLSRIDKNARGINIGTVEDLRGLINVDRG